MASQVCYSNQIRQVYNDALYSDNPQLEKINFQVKKINTRIRDHKTQDHANIFDDLMDALADEYPFEDGEYDETDETDEKYITPQRSCTDDPIEEYLLARHVHELLYNILIASHHRMKKNLHKMLNKLHSQSNGSNDSKEIDSEKTIKRFLPTDTKLLKRTQNLIFEEIITTYYPHCTTFSSECKSDIMRYIARCCHLCVSMLLADRELSFFPLLFTNKTSSYIYPNVRYDKIIKKSEMRLKPSRSLECMNRLPPLRQTTPLLVSSKTLSFDSPKAEKSFNNTRHERSYSSLDSSYTNDILYYSFPGVRDQRNKTVSKCEVFTYDNPELFVRHDLNWIFKNKFHRNLTIDKFRNDQMALLSGDDQDSNDNNNQILILSIDEKVLKNEDFIKENALFRDWKSFKKQQRNALNELISDQLMDALADLDLSDQGEGSQSRDDTSSDEGDDELYSKCSKIASMLMFETIVVCRNEMQKHRESDPQKEKKMVYLNMLSLYKYNAKNNKKKSRSNKPKTISYEAYIASIIDDIFQRIICTQKYSKYSFLKKNRKIKADLHVFIAQCCELMYNILFYDFDIFPLISDANGDEVAEFNDLIHINDRTVSGNACKNIEYYCFPGIIVKESINDFEKLVSESKLTNEKQVLDYLKCPMYVCLNDDIESDFTEIEDDIE